MKSGLELNYSTGRTVEVKKSAHKRYLWMRSNKGRERPKKKSFMVMISILNNHLSVHIRRAIHMKYAETVPSWFLLDLKVVQVHGSQSPIRLLRVSRCLIKSFNFLTWFNLST